jgi:hypothetical protein
VTVVLPGVAATEHPSDDIQQLDRLVQALERANDALRSGSGKEGDDALAEGLNVLGAHYGALSPTDSPEACAHLEAAYDACLRGLGDAYGGNRDALVGAIAILRAIRAALAPAPTAVSRAA